MNNRSFQKAINFVFTLALAFGLLLPASSTLALPQKAAPRAVGNSTPNDTRYLTSEQWNLNRHLWNQCACGLDYHERVRCRCSRDRYWYYHPR